MGVLIANKRWNEPRDHNDAKNSVDGGKFEVIPDLGVRDAEVNSVAGREKEDKVPNQAKYSI